MKAHLASVLLCGPLLLAGCDRPGEGAQAAAGFVTAEPVSAALEQFEVQNGHYPERLAYLVPTYLSEVPGEVGGYPLEAHNQTVYPPVNPKVGRGEEKGGSRVVKGIR